MRWTTCRQMSKEASEIGENEEEELEKKRNKRPTEGETQRQRVWGLDFHSGTS